MNSSVCKAAPAPSPPPPSLSLAMRTYTESVKGHAHLLSPRPVAASSPPKDRVGSLTIPVFRLRRRTRTLPTGA